MKKTLILTAVSAGLLGGIAFIAFSLVLYQFYGSILYPPAPKFNDFFIYLVTLVVVFYVYRFRLNPHMSFWQGLSLGSIILGLMLGISLFFLYFFLARYAPEVFEMYKNKLHAQMQITNPEILQQYGGEENYQKMLLAVKNATLSQYLWLEIRQKVALGFFIILIASAFLRYRTVKIFSTITKSS